MKVSTRFAMFAALFLGLVVVSLVIALVGQWGYGLEVPVPAYVVIWGALTISQVYVVGAGLARLLQERPAPRVIWGEDRP